LLFQQLVLLQLLLQNRGFRLGCLASCFCTLYRAAGLFLARADLLIIKLREDLSLVDVVTLADADVENAPRGFRCDTGIVTLNPPAERYEFVRFAASIRKSSPHRDDGTECARNSGSPSHNGDSQHECRRYYGQALSGPEPRWRLGWGPFPLVRARRHFRHLVIRHSISFRSFFKLRTIIFITIVIYTYS
jgi:hypothetical protein